MADSSRGKGGDEGPWKTRFQKFVLMGFGIALFMALEVTGNVIYYFTRNSTWFWQMRDIGLTSQFTLHGGLMYRPHSLAGKLLAERLIREN